MQGKRGLKQEKANRHNRNVRALRICTGVFLLLALLLCGVLVSGKYVYTTYEVAEVQPERFIFVTNFDDDETYIYANGTTGTVTLTLSNHEAGLTTKSNITYNVSVTNKAGEAVASVSDSKKGILIGNEPTDSIIQISELVVGDTYEVNILSTAPYEKTLTYKFHVMPAVSNADYYSITKNTNWIQLDIYTGADDPGNIIVNYNTVLAPDNTNEFMRDWTSAAGKGTLTGLESNAQYSFIFFGSSESVSKTQIIGNEITIS